MLNTLFHQINTLSSAGHANSCYAQGSRTCIWDSEWSKLLKLGEGEVNNRAIEALAKFEEQMGRNKRPYRDYQEDSMGEWNSSDESEEN